VRVQLLTAVALFALASPAEAEWWEARTDHFIVYSESSAANAKDFAEKMERLDMSLRALQTIKFSPATSDALRLTVFRFGDTDEINWVFTGGRGNAGIAGFYSPNINGSVAYTPARLDSRNTGALLGATGRSEKTKLDPQQVLFHEYTHHFMYQHFSAAYPSWYSEGFAETAATIVLRPDGSFHLGNPPQYRSEAMFQSMLNVSAERMLASTNKPNGEDQYGWYTVGWLLNHYLTFEPSRKGQLKEYLRMVNAGTLPGEAARKAFGDLDLLNRQLIKYKSGRLPGVDVKIGNYSPPSVEMRRLAPDEEAIMKVRMRSKRGVDKKLAGKVAGDARTVAAKYPNSYAVQLALAEAELDEGSFDESNLPRAEAAADRALALKADSADAMTLKGRVLLERGKKDKGQLANARQWFAKAYDEDPERPAPLFYNYLTYYESGGAIPESALIGLEKAYDIAKYDNEIKLVLARQLLAEKKGPLARSILMPYAVEPHESKGAKKMREVVDLIDAQKVDDAYKMLAGEMAEQERKRKAGDDD
jgi:tetratricopeptide (TPR) repeat protein